MDNLRIPLLQSVCVYLVSLPHIANSYQPYWTLLDVCQCRVCAIIMRISKGSIGLNSNLIIAESIDSSYQPAHACIVIRAPRVLFCFIYSPSYIHIYICIYCRATTVVAHWCFHECLTWKICHLRRLLLGHAIENLHRFCNRPTHNNSQRASSCTIFIPRAYTRAQIYLHTQIFMFYV